jgi:hypothetical protein
MDETIEKTTAGRILNPNDFRNARSREQYERYDSVCVFDGAESKTKGWFNSFAAFGNSTQLTWFASRDSNVDLAYSNSTSERLDQAQDIYSIQAAFYADTHQAQFASLSAQNQAAVLWWTQELPKYLALTALLGDSDILAQATADRFMAGAGNVGGFAQDTGASVVNGGNNGNADRTNGYHFPDPILLAAQSKLVVKGQIATPLKTSISDLLGPGYVEVPRGDGTYTRKPIQYGIKITMRGPRYLQLRGAYSAR